MSPSTCQNALDDLHKGKIEAATPCWWFVQQFLGLPRFRGLAGTSNLKLEGWKTAGRMSSFGSCAILWNRINCRWSSFVLNACCQHVSKTVLLCFVTDAAYARMGNASDVPQTLGLKGVKLALICYIQQSCMQTFSLNGGTCRESI